MHDNKNVKLNYYEKSTYLSFMAPSQLSLICLAILEIFLWSILKGIRKSKNTLTYLKNMS